MKWKFVIQSLYVHLFNHPQKIPRKTYTKMCVLDISEEWNLEDQARRGWIQFYFTHSYPECLITLPFSFNMCLNKNDVGQV